MRGVQSQFFPLFVALYVLASSEKQFLLGPQFTLFIAH